MGMTRCSWDFMEYAKKSRNNKAQTGHFKKSGAEGVKFQREFRLLEGTEGDLKAGDRVLAGEFKPKEKVDVIGISKGRGFAGVVKRHHFRGSDATHGSMFCGSPGSIGASSFRRASFLECAWVATWARISIFHAQSGNRRSRHRGQRHSGQGRGPGPNGGYVIVRRTKK